MHFRSTFRTAALCGATALLLSCGDDPQVIPQVVDIIVVVAPGGAGAGNVSSGTAELVLDCDIAAGASAGTCSNGFSDAGGVGSFTLLAVPEAGSSFGSWSTVCETSSALGACTASVNQATLVVEYDNAGNAGTVTVDVTASFN